MNSVSRSCGKCVFNFIRNYYKESKLFSKMAASFCISIAMHENSRYSISLLTFNIVSYFFYFSHSDMYIVVFVISISISLMINDVDIYSYTY